MRISASYAHTVVLVVLASSGAWADRLAILGPPAGVNLGSPSTPFSVLRETDSGVGINTGTLTVTLTTSSARGQFALSPSVAATWSPTLMVTIADTQFSSPLVYYRDGATGRPTVLAMAPAFSGVSMSIVVRPLILHDTVESGTLYVNNLPAGSWNSNWQPAPQNTLSASMAAAHRGSWGLRLDDAAGNAGSGGQNAVFFDTPPIAGDLYFRSWLRVTIADNLGDAVVVQLTNGGASSQSILDYLLDLPSRQLFFEGFDNTAAPIPMPSDGGFIGGAWHLIELATLGVGTDAGQQLAAIDGAPIFARAALSWEGGTWDVQRLAVGEPFSNDQRFRGQLDFDDIAAAAVPLASRLVVTPPPAPLSVGACGQASVGLASTWGASVIPSMYALSGALVVDGGAAFADPSCLTPTSSFFLDAGATAGAFFVKALAPATVQLTAAFIDYLPGSATVLAVTPDGGTADAGSADAGSSDAGGTDAGGTDAGSTDAGSTDAGSTDAGSTDAGGTDAGGTDAGGTDAGGTDAGGTDAGDADAGSTDAGVDAGTSDAGDQPGLGGSTRELALGCDCASVDFASAWLGLALAFTLRRWAAKRRHR